MQSTNQKRSRNKRSQLTSKKNSTSRIEAASSQVATPKNVLPQDPINVDDEEIKEGHPV